MSARHRTVLGVVAMGLALLTISVAPVWAELRPKPRPTPTPCEGTFYCPAEAPLCVGEKGSKECICPRLSATFAGKIPITPSEMDKQCAKGETCCINWVDAGNLGKTMAGATCCGPDAYCTDAHTCRSQLCNGQSPPAADDTHSWICCDLRAEHEMATDATKVPNCGACGEACPGQECKKNSSGFEWSCQ